jgi:hypothetical protein
MKFAPDFRFELLSEIKSSPQLVACKTLKNGIGTVAWGLTGFSSMDSKKVVRAVLFEIRQEGEKPALRMRAPEDAAVLTFPDFLVDVDPTTEVKIHATSSQVKHPESAVLVAPNQAKLLTVWLDNGEPRGLDLSSGLISPLPQVDYVTIFRRFRIGIPGNPPRWVIEPT